MSDIIYVVDKKPRTPNGMALWRLVVVGMVKWGDDALLVCADINGQLRTRRLDEVTVVGMPARFEGYDKAAADDAAWKTPPKAVRRRKTA